MEGTVRIAPQRSPAVIHPTYKWWLLVVLFLIGALNYGDRTAVAAVFPLLRKELGTSDLALAAIGSLFLWSYALGSPLAGFLADRFSRSRLIVWSLVGWSLATLLSGMVTATWQLLGARVLLGIAECAYLPAAIALIADHHGPDTRGTGIGLHNAGLNFGLVMGGLAAGYIGEHLGWRPVFLLLGSAGLVMAVVAQRLLRDGPVAEPQVIAEARPSMRQSLSVLFHIPTFWILTVEAASIAVATWMFLNWLPLYFSEVHHMSLAGAGFSGTFLLQAPSLLGVTLGGYFSDRVAGAHLHRRMLIQCIFYFLAAPCLLAFLGKPAMLLVSVSLFSYGLFRASGSCNESPLLCDLLDPQLRATAIGLTNTTNTLAGGTGIFVAALLKKDFGLAGVFGGCSVLLLFSGFLVLGGYLFFIRKDLARRPLNNLRS